jgi:hypothetical protein
VVKSFVAGMDFLNKCAPLCTSVCCEKEVFHSERALSHNKKSSFGESPLATVEQSNSGERGAPLWPLFPALGIALAARNAHLQTAP